ncbi:MAG: GNAT family N-acetyltransferase [Clostridiaceae bacterium]|nr:GNAT family N-acetyltransferase [Clostridiaceae bacterium]
MEAFIEPLNRSDVTAVERAGALLVEAFHHSWPDLVAGIKEIEGCLEEGKIALIARRGEQVVGFAGAMPQYGITGWELHPIVVARDVRGKGVGRALLREIETRVADRGGIMLYAGSDDESDQTSLSNCDLYDGLWERIRDLSNPGGHAVGFYFRCGYRLVGVMPDANGYGKPDLYLAKRLRPAAGYPVD